MGNYASNAELQTRFEDVEEVAFLTDTEADTPPSTPDQDVLTDVIEGAEGDINSRIGKRYATPVDETVDTELAATLKRRTLDIAEVYLLQRGGVVTEAHQRQLDRAIEWADKVSTGEFVLPGGVTPTSTASRNPVSEWTGSNRTLASTSPRLWTRDTTANL